MQRLSMPKGRHSNQPIRFKLMRNWPIKKQKKYQWQILKQVVCSLVLFPHCSINVEFVLKLLGLYLYSYIISHKTCKMLSIVNKLTLQKDLQNIVTNKVFFGQKLKTQQQQNKKSNLKTLGRGGNWTGTSCPPKGSVTTAPPS